jgi:hypothetical protein
VIVHDLNMLRAIVSPLKADPVSDVDPDAPLACPITLKTLEAIARGYSQLFKPDNGVKLI